MNYSRAKRCYDSGSLVFWQGQHWHIKGLNQLNKTATLVQTGGYVPQDAPLKEITE